MLEADVGGPAVLPALGVVRPHRLAGGGIDGRHLRHLGGDVEQAAGHDRHHLELARAHGGVGFGDLLRDRLPLPSDLELAEVGAVDLVERRVAVAAGVASERGPVAGGHARLDVGGLLGNGDREHREQQDWSE